MGKCCMTTNSKPEKDKSIQIKKPANNVNLIRMNNHQELADDGHHVAPHSKQRQQQPMGEVSESDMNKIYLEFTDA